MAMSKRLILCEAWPRSKTQYGDMADTFATFRAALLESVSRIREWLRLVADEVVVDIDHEHCRRCRNQRACRTERANTCLSRSVKVSSQVAMNRLPSQKATNPIRADGLGLSRAERKSFNRCATFKPFKSFKTSRLFS